MSNSTTRFLVFLVFVLGMGFASAMTYIAINKGKPAVESASASGASSGKSGADEKAVRSIMDAYLEEHPEVIVNAFMKARQAQMAKDEQDAGKNIAARMDELQNDPATPFTGNPKADVTIVMFSDYNCGFCKHSMPDIIALLKEDKNVRLVSKDFPILGDRSQVNARAALAVWGMDKDKWFDFHVDMLKDTPQTDDQLLAMATKHGIAADKLKEEMAKQKYLDRIQANLQLGQNIGVRGTPAFVINGDFLRGALDLQTLKAKVAEIRSKGGKGGEKPAEKGAKG